MEISGFFLLFLLGIRHGFDPDHIAFIDGVSMRYADSKPALAKWAGTLFAIGHSSIVTMIAIMISLFSRSVHLSKNIWDLLEWVPGLLLIGVGVVNARMLLKKGKESYSPTGIRSWLLPEKIRNSSNPLMIVLTGALFAMVFDTTTQAAAWAYTASAHTNRALLLGLCFSVGMITTDTLDSRVLFLLVKKYDGRQGIVGYRRTLGWLIVAISFMVGLYKIVTHIRPSWEMSDVALTAIGVGFFILMGLGFLLKSDRYGY